MKKIVFVLAVSSLVACGAANQTGSAVKDTLAQATKLGNCLRLEGDISFEEVIVYGESDGRVSFIEYKNQQRIAGGYWRRNSLGDLGLFADLGEEGNVLRLSFLADLTGDNSKAIMKLEEMTSNGNVTIRKDRFCNVF